MRHKSQETKNSILNYINDFFYSNRRTPSTREIAAHIGTTQSNTRNYLIEMDEERMLSYRDGDISTDMIDGMSFASVNVPIAGTVSCGLPQLEEEYISRYVPIPREFLGKGEFYILIADGESMINAGISPGDYVFIEKTRSARDGDIVVALVDNETTTLKRMYLDRASRRVILHPENDSMPDQYYDSIEIQGVARHVLKKL